MAAFPSIFQTKYLSGPTKQTCSYAAYSVEICSIKTRIWISKLRWVSMEEAEEAT
jgi:hypothetical protein